MSKYLHNRRILIGITGGIAAYKILELIRNLREHGAQVKIILTASGKEFVTPLSLQALAGEKIYEELFSLESESAMSHIDLARWAEVLLIAPATANFIAKFAYGIADDLLTTVSLATNAQVLIAPAMNQQMWLNAATQQNITTIKQRNVNILGPGSGSQACGEVGPGRMLEAHELSNLLNCYFAPQLLSNKHLLITAGPTQEAIDPVRYLSNHSSGKMGYALAKAALQLGAKVTLISGPTKQTLPMHSNLQIVSVISASDMYIAVEEAINNHKIDVFIGCAAVADYTPILPHSQKIKKTGTTLTLELQRTKDILAMVASLPEKLRPFTVGFAAETENLIDNANAKLQNKCLDLIIANAVDNGKVFNQDSNQVIVLRKDTSPVVLDQMHKEVLAFRLLEEISQ